MLIASFTDHVLVVDRLGAEDRPALLAGRAQPVAERALGGTALQRLAARQLLERQRPALLVEDLESLAHRFERGGEELRRRLEADEPRRGVVRVPERRSGRTR